MLEIFRRTQIDDFNMTLASYIKMNQVNLENVLNTTDIIFQSDNSIKQNRTKNVLSDSVLKEIQSRQTFIIVILGFIVPVICATLLLMCLGVRCGNRDQIRKKKFCFQYAKNVSRKPAQYCCMQPCCCVGLEDIPRMFSN